MSASDRSEMDVERQARVLDFGRAFELFPDDVLEAAQRAANERAALTAPDDPSCEPWPPMQCPHDD
ncbi:MAG: hypothetical protein WDN02_01360 [Methylovirgula sp.]|uniref:hypothetical protein n=1 Tax=Methylovirgula sp. TaxID=1978224 RepID=UPI0030762902